MKKVLSFIIALVLCIGLCACSGTNNSGAGNDQNGTSNSEAGNAPSKMTSEYAADKMVPEALEQWMSTKILSFECTDFDYSITSIEKNNRKFSSDSENGMRWYDAYGVAKFYDKYGDVLMIADFVVVFGHNADSSMALIESDTVVTPRY